VRGGVPSGRLSRAGTERPETATMGQWVRLRDAGLQEWLGG
jgi:hypothetical protein